MKIDANDVVEINDSDSLAEEIDRLTEDAPNLSVSNDAPSMCPQEYHFVPFPVDDLPTPAHEFVKDGAEAIGCDESYLALPLLATLGAAIGNSRCIRLKVGWTAPPILWTVLVGESGQQKSPPLKLILKTTRKRQRNALDEHEKTVEEHSSQLAEYEKSMSQWKRDKNTTELPPVAPDLPAAERFIVEDTTVEALAPILRTNPRGLLLAKDELAGWLGSFDRYASSGKGSADASHWLSMYNGETIIVDRKTGSPRTIFVPCASICVTGGIQPAILNRALGQEHRENGLLARLLLTYPPRRLKRWTEAEINPQAEQELERLLNGLFELKPRLGDDGDPVPVALHLTPDAKSIWIEYFSSHAAELVDMDGELASAWSKLEETAARLALVIHCTRLVSGDTSESDVVDHKSMVAGVKLAEWFKNETRRVYAILCETEEAQEERRLVELVARKGGRITARELRQSSRRFRDSTEMAEAALNNLVSAGYGHWNEVQPGKIGGRPTRAFELSKVSTSTKPVPGLPL